MSAPPATIPPDLLFLNTASPIVLSPSFADAKMVESEVAPSSLSPPPQLPLEVEGVSSVVTVPGSSSPPSLSSISDTHMSDMGSDSPILEVPPTPPPSLGDDGTAPSLGGDVANHVTSPPSTLDPFPAVSVDGTGVLGASPFLAQQQGHATSPTTVDIEAPTKEFGYTWATRFTSSCKIPQSSAKVTISPSGRPRVKVPNAVFERGAKLHQDFIVGIFYGTPPSYGKIWAVLNFLWGKDKRVTIHNLTKNAFLFYIPSPALRKKVLQQELWRVGDSPFFVTEWKAEFSFNPPSLAKASIWETIKNIPFDLVTDEGLSFIAKSLGRVVDAKPFTSINSAEIKVIADLTKPLPKDLEIERDDGAIWVLSVSYPWLPPLCHVCDEVGHKATMCPKAEPAKKNVAANSKKPSDAGLKEKAPVKKTPLASVDLVETQYNSFSPVKSNVTDQVIVPVEERTFSSPPVSSLKEKGGSLASEVVDDPPFIRAAKTVSSRIHQKPQSDMLVNTNPFAMLQKDKGIVDLVDAGTLVVAFTSPASSEVYRSQKKKKWQEKIKSNKLKSGQALLLFGSTC